MEGDEGGERAYSAVPSVRMSRSHVRAGFVAVPLHTSASLGGGRGFCHPGWAVVLHRQFSFVVISRPHHSI
eukprot:COSAG02_NODE_9040_length_2353_cov_1.457853_4_plen_70_part_01